MSLINLSSVSINSGSAATHAPHEIPPTQEPLWRHVHGQVHEGEGPQSVRAPPPAQQPQLPAAGDVGGEERRQQGADQEPEEESC